MAIAGFGETAEQLRRSTVLIHSGGRGCGSGVIWSSDGLIVTNAHVVRSSNTRVQLWDGREFRVELVSRYVRRAIAQLHIAQPAPRETRGHPKAAREYSNCAPHAR